MRHCKKKALPLITKASIISTIYLVKKFIAIEISSRRKFNTFIGYFNKNPEFPTWVICFDFFSLFNSCWIVYLIEEYKIRIWKYIHTERVLLRCKELKEERDDWKQHPLITRRVVAFYINGHAAQRRDRMLLQLNVKKDTYIPCILQFFSIFFMLTVAVVIVVAISFFQYLIFCLCFSSWILNNTFLSMMVISLSCEHSFPFCFKTLFVHLYSSGIRCSFTFHPAEGRGREEGEEEEKEEEMKCYKDVYLPTRECIYFFTVKIVIVMSGIFPGGKSSFG